MGTPLLPNINRTDTTGFYNNTFEYYLNSWTRYRVTVEYVSGAVSSNRVYTCLAFQGYNEDGGRDYVDVQTTYCNNTEVAVAAELLTAHNNNSNRYDWNTDDGTLKDRVQCDTSSVSNSEFKESLVVAPNQHVTEEAIPLKFLLLTIIK